MTIEKLGPYRIERIIGHGGMGTVYEGAHLETGERAAIKVLSEGLGADPRFRERFKAEIESLKRLRHSNIVRLYGFGSESGRLFFTMELVDGPSIETELRRGRRFDWREAATLGTQMCAALKHAHDHGVVHRDLKPGNLLLAADGTVKLTDFGIAKSFGLAGLTLAGSMIGTPEYMAPEQTEGQPATPRSDLYSLGCVLYAMMTGGPPFWNPVVTRLIDQVRHDPPPRLSLHVPDVPFEFERLLHQLLEKKPERRIATPLLLANLLQSMLHAIASDTQAGHPTDNRPTPARKINIDAVSPRDGSESPETNELTPPGGLTGEVGPRESDSTEVPTKAVSLTQQQGSSDEESITFKVPATSSDQATEVGEVPGDLDHPPADETSYVPVSMTDWQKSFVGDTRSKSKHTDRWSILAMVVGLLVILALSLYALTPPSADRLFDQINSSADRSSDAYGKLLTQFLNHYPEDPRSDQVARYYGRYQCVTFQDELQKKLRALTETEQLYLQGMRDLDVGNEVAAKRCFQKIRDLLSSKPSGIQQRRLLERVTFLLDEELGEVEVPQSKPVEDGASQVDLPPE